MKRRMKRWLSFTACLAFAVPAQALDWGEVLKGVLGKPQSEAQPAATGVDALSSSEINAGLKEALTRGAEAAVAQLGQKDGFFGNAELRIPLPEPLKKPRAPCACLAWAGRPTSSCWR